MAFNTAAPRAEYQASAGQTSFPFVFKIFNDTDLKVYKTLANIAPNETNDLLILDTDYTVSIDGDAGGSITLSSGASINDAITLLRDLPTTREIEYQTSGDLLAETLNDDQEYQTYLLADNKQVSNRTLIFEENLQGMDNKLPTPEALRLLRWNSTGKALENTVISDDGVFVNIFNIDSIADLLLVNPLVYSTVNVRGYHSANDGGGGLFNYDASQSTVNNGGTIINGWVRQYSGAINVKWFGAKGDSTTDDTTSLLNAFAVLSTGDTLDLDKGVYKSVPTDANTIFPNTLNTRDKGLYVIKDKQRISIINGEIQFEEGTATDRVVAIFFENCYGCKVDKVTIDGGFIPDEAYVDDSDRFGLFFHNSRACTLINSRLTAIKGAALSITGLGQSPATIVTNSHNHIITNNLFHTYQQISTFGAGAEGYIFSNNIMVNAWGACIKQSENYNDLGFAGSTGKAVISNNVMYWTDAFEAPLTFDGITRWSQNGIMLESQARDTLIIGNTISTENSNYTDNGTCPIIIIGSGKVTDLRQDRVSIQSNLLTGDRYSIFASGASAYNLDINGNTLNAPFLQLGSAGNIAPTRLGSISCIGNTIKNNRGNILSPTILIQYAFHDVFEFVSNIVPDDITFSVTDVDVSTFRVIRNTGFLDIDVAGTFDLLDLSYNDLRDFDFVGDMKQYSIDNNNGITNSTLLNLTCNSTVDRASASGNKVIGQTTDTAGGFLQINQTSGIHNVLAGNNSLRVNTSGAFNLTGTIVFMGGDLIGSGSPEGVIDAYFGTFYKRMDVPDNLQALFYKGSISGNTGWDIITMTNAI